MAVLYTNNAVSALAAGINTTATSFSVTSGQGSKFPTISGTDYFYVTLVNSSSNIEIVKVTARSTDTFTVVRAQDGTTALTFATGDVVELRLTRAVLDDIKTDAITSKRINPRAATVVSNPSSLAPDISANDQYSIKSLAQTCTIAAPVGTPKDGNKMLFRIATAASGTPVLSWTSYTAVGVTLPTTLTINKIYYVGCVYNDDNARWDVVAVTNT
jgi:hypothetical protein